MVNNIDNLTPPFTYQPPDKVHKQSGVKPDSQKTTVKKPTKKRKKKPSEEAPKVPRPTGNLIDTSA